MLSDRPGTPGRRAQMPRHQQLDRDTLAGGEVEGVDQRLVDDRVGLEPDARGAAGLVVGDLGVDLLDQPGAHRVGGDQQLGVRRVARPAGEVVEQVRDVLGDPLVGGDQPEVLVHPGGLGVVVAGADVGIAADAAMTVAGVALVADDHRELAVGLEPDDAVDDVAAGLLELACPADVGLLVEARLDLDDHQHLLAGLGGVDEGVDDRGVARRAVERLLDRQHVRVGGGLLDEALHRGGERVVGVVQQHVVAACGLEHVDGCGRLHLGEAVVGGGEERGVLQLLAREVGDAVQAAQVQRAGQPVDLVLADAELADEQLEDGGGRWTPRPPGARAARSGGAAAPSPGRRGGSRRRPPRPRGPRCG